MIYLFSMGVMSTISCLENSLISLRMLRLLCFFMRVKDITRPCYFVPFIFFLEVAYVIVINIRYLICQREPYLFIREFFQQLLSYCMNIIVISLAPYGHHRHLHLETLYLYSLVLFGELCQTQWVGDGLWCLSVLVQHQTGTGNLRELLGS
jgi:hypothetical protein